jgi:hypothetical protein
MDKLTHDEAGELLRTVSRMMILDDVGAQCTQDGNCNLRMLRDLENAGIEPERAQELIRLDLVEVVQFNFYTPGN